uniref:Putative light-regulated protein n=1 Tax=Davidia involucrata TaxID=16924 RepID=A0A5B7BHU4_DAVIN
MQAALCFAPHLLSSTPAKNSCMLVSSPPKLARSRCFQIKATYETSSTVDYSSTISVFPAEACETIGGDACLADIYPEVKIKSEAKSNMMRIASELIDREYLEYNEPKTVLRGEACDVLGGEFCGRAYQKGVY